MIIIMKPQATEEQIGSLCHDLSRQGMQVQRNAGVDCTVLGVLGDVARLDPHDFLIQPGVERVMPVSEPFKKANRKFHPTDSVIDCSGVKVGGRKLALFAGPCSVENYDQITDTALKVRAGGANILRGGAYKPRTSPYAFQGLKLEGLALLEQAKELTGMPICTEIMSPKLVEEFDRRVDVIQVGARNMQNFDLLTELGQTHKPILLKRGLHHGGGQSERHPLRARHPHVRDLHAQHARSVGGAGGQAPEPSAGDRRSLPCDGPELDGGAHVAGGDCGGCGRPDYRSA